MTEDDDMREYKLRVRAVEYQLMEGELDPFTDAELFVQFSSIRQEMERQGKAIAYLLARLALQTQDKKDQRAFMNFTGLAEAVEEIREEIRKKSESEG